MACLDPDIQEIYEASLAAKKAQLTAFYTSALTAVPNSEISQYELDTGEGRQRAWRRAPKALQDAIDKLEAEILWTIRKLNGGGQAVFRLCR